MLRRRILASAMASVMAIGSVAVVANAENATVTQTQTKSKADLEKYVKSFDSFRENELYNYGSISGENFLDALEYADNVLADSKSTVDDFTVAYAMIEAVYNNLNIYSAAELKTLIDKCRRDYETNNILNEELGDNIWPTGSFQKFEDAFDNAESVLESSDSRIITDAYEELEAAWKGLIRLPVVTKAMFRSALKEYETALQKQHKYDTWRVGKIDAGGDGELWAYTGHTVAYGTLFEHVESAKDQINAQYDFLDKVKTLKETTNTDVTTSYKSCVELTAVLNGFVPDDTERASKSKVEALLKEYHGRLVYDYATTAAEKLYQVILDEVGEEELHNYTKDSEYVASMHKKDNAVTSKEAWVIFEGKYTAKNPRANASAIWSGKKLNSAEMKIMSDTKFYLALDEQGYAIGISTDGKSVKAYVNDDVKDTNVAKFKLINKGNTIELTDYVKVTHDMIIDEISPTDNHGKNNVEDGDLSAESASPYGIGDWAAWDVPYAVNRTGANYLDGVYKDSDQFSAKYYTDLAFAIKMADLYLNGDIKGQASDSGIYELDTIGAISPNSAKGSSVEWTLVYRYLKYALSDKYDGTTGTKTRADVVKLIEDCYDLAEKTGDAAIFHTNHNELVEERQFALNWVKATYAVKTYKDNVTSIELNYGNWIATEVWEKLNKQYKKLNSDFNAFKYSFEEIYNKIAEVKDMVDEGEVKATPELLAALENASLKLSCVKSLVTSSDEEVDINDAFTDDRFFEGYNRVMTAESNYKITIDKTKYEFYAAKDTGDNRSHYELKKAYEALIAEVKAQTEKKYELGDVNKDGYVNAKDAAEILKAVVDNATASLENADFNADGTVDSKDAAAILKHVVDTL